MRHSKRLLTSAALGVVWTSPTLAEDALLASFDPGNSLPTHSSAASGSYLVSAFDRSNPIGRIAANAVNDDRLLIETQAFLRLAKPIVSQDQYNLLNTRLSPFATMSPDMLNGTGVTLQADGESLLLRPDLGLSTRMEPKTAESQEPGSLAFGDLVMSIYDAESQSGEIVKTDPPLDAATPSALQSIAGLDLDAQSPFERPENALVTTDSSRTVHTALGLGSMFAGLWQQSTEVSPVQETPSSQDAGEDEPPNDDILDPDQPLPETPGSSVNIPLPGAENAAETSEETSTSSPSTPISSVPLGPHGRPDINPYDRDIEMTVPLTYLARTLGEIPILMTADDRIFLETQQFLQLMDSILNEPAQEELISRLEMLNQFEPEDLADTGVALTYDPSTLAVVVVEVAPEQRATINLFAPPREDSDQATLQPANFSSFLNLGVIQSYIWEGGITPDPTLTIDGAIRVGSIVFEGDGQFAEELGLTDTSYRFRRNFARLVYDEPEEFRRWFAGDLDPEIRGQQSFVSMGGVGVVRQQRRFNGFRSAILQANRELVIQRESSVRFLRNGVLFRELRLQPGRYDFSQLPLIAGSNDVDIQIADNNGQIQNLSFQQYLDPIDLDPGDYEYGAYFGPTSSNFVGAPDYSGPLAFTGFYRKAFFDRPALGIGVQASEDVQTLTSQIQFVLPNSGRLLLDGGVSNSSLANQGFAVGVSYEHFFERNGFADTLTVRADYLSEDFASLGNIQAINTTEATITAQYTRQFSEEFIATADASYLRGRFDTGDSYRIGANGFYQLDRRWTFRAGIEYVDLPGIGGAGSGINITAGIVFQPSFRRRAEARYESRNDLYELSYNQSGLNQLNTLGFGAVLSRQNGSALGQGFVGYSANRFDVGASHATFGPDISNVADNNISTVRVGTSIAYAGGQVGLGRRINDSFILFAPHPTLNGRSVVAGQSLAENRYIGRSGALGSAVNNFLGSYAMQSAQYDVEDPPVGYDTGPGIYRVFPPYKSGYAARVGTDAFVTAMGTFYIADGEPISLAGGRVTLLDLDEGEDIAPLPFFTNSVGRFAISSLLPNRRYLVETFGPNGTIAYTFEFTIPADTDGLVRMGEVRPGDTIEQTQDTDQNAEQDVDQIAASGAGPHSPEGEEFP